MGTLEAQFPSASSPMNDLAPQCPSPPICPKAKGASTKRSCLSHAKHGLLRKFFQYTPYPSSVQKEELAVKIGIKSKQISNWFANARRREPSEKQTNHPEQPVHLFAQSRMSFANRTIVGIRTEMAEYSPEG